MRLVIFRTTITGRSATGAADTAGFGERPIAAQDEKKAVAPAIQAHARSTRLESRGRFAAFVVPSVIAAAAARITIVAAFGLIAGAVVGAFGLLLELVVALRHRGRAGGRRGALEDDRPGLG